MSDPVTVAVPKEYGWVVLTGVLGSFVINMYLSYKVGQARKKHGVKFPTVYSADNQLFNCVQRGHQHFLENQPFFLAAHFIGGLQHPYVATAGGLIYLLGRVFYMRGYSTGDPQKRSQGFFAFFGFFACLGASVSFAYHLLK